MTPPLLSIKNLTKRFSGLLAVDGFSLDIEEGTIHGLIGPNGAGKTTSFNLISGFYRPTSGSIVFKGKEISGLRMHEVAQYGLVRTFQHSTLFSELTVLENALVGTHMAYRPRLIASILGMDRTMRIGARAQAINALRFFDLHDRAHERAGDLPHGHQRALGMAVAIASQPQLVLLDEPFTGMNPEETGRMMLLMQKLKKNGITILLVEHDMHAIMGLCDRITCMSFGKFLAEGSPQEIQSHPQVIEAYLGVSHSAA